MSSKQYLEFDFATQISLSFLSLFWHVISLPASSIHHLNVSFLCCLKFASNPQTSISVIWTNYTNTQQLKNEWLATITSMNHSAINWNFLTCCKISLCQFRLFEKVQDNRKITWHFPLNFAVLHKKLQWLCMSITQPNIIHSSIASSQLTPHKITHKVYKPMVAGFNMTMTIG